MTIYLLLLALIFVVKIIELGLPNVKKSRLTTVITMVAIFMVLALKKSTVGIDIEGYQAQYYLSKTISWSNYDYVYFENGYIFLMKLFSKTGISFELFCAILYAFSCLMMCKLITKYSNDGWLSVIIFLCYQFFVLYTSGLRQMVAMSICIFAFLVLDSEKYYQWIRTLLAIIIVFIATTVHSSAYIFYFVIATYFFKGKRIPVFLTAVSVCAAIVLRPYIINIINAVFGRHIENRGMTVGGNFMFLILLSAFSYLGILQKNLNESEITSEDCNKEICFNNLVAKLLVLATLSQIAFSGSSMLRSSMYLTMFAIPGTPNIIKCYERKIQIVAYTCIIALMIFIFVHDTLMANQLSICPYKFLWQ